FFFYKTIGDSSSLYDYIRTDNPISWIFIFKKKKKHFSLFVRIKSI
ncbi:hypothetical protein PROSTU_00722, partial [Providencia stuartii ATCC 25827]